MIARLQAWIAVFLCAFMCTCFLAAFRTGSWSWVLLPAAVVAVQLSVLIVELLIQRLVSRRSDSPALRAEVILRCALKEFLQSSRVFCVEQPFRSRRFPDRLSTARPRTGVVLLHGFYCNRGVWNRWMRKLARVDIPFLAVNLEPPFGSIDDYAPSIDDAVRRMTEATGRPPVVVGHSMGGLAARAWLATCAQAARVSCVVTIGTPHHGTLLSRFARSTNARQMSPGSVWLTALAAREPRDLARRFVCFYSDADNVIIPSTSARWSGADNRMVAATPHLAMLDAPEVFDAVVDLVDAADRTQDATP